jgi:hypothetical protein
MLGGWTITNSRLFSMTYKSLRSCATALIVAGFAFGGVPHADARKAEREDRFVPNHAPGTPLLAVVGLAEQRISIYDAKGKIMESPVSSGQTAYETPAGIYSVVQKEEEHHSNLYDDASMPFMERITWTGMALHAGVLPGYPASHGCVRLPHDFAERLYDVTNMGMRVVVVREDITPAEASQPFMFGSTRQKGPGADRSLREGISPTRYSPSASDDILSQLRMTLAQRSAEAQNAARKVKDLRLAASKSNTEAASAAQSLQAAESNFAKAEADVKAIDQAFEKAAPEKVAQLAEAKAQALSKLNIVQAQLDTAKAQAQAKADAAAQAQADVKTADAALSLALDASEEARLNLNPVSVFISRKTMRLYVRKANLPVYESYVMISDPNKPIGSFVFTALEAGPSGAMKWNVVSMYKDATNIEPFSKEKQSAARRRDAAPADVAGADAALNRLTIPEDALDYISKAVLPGSSLIISDEGPSIETGKDTDFVVFMSGEPQGGIAVRAHHHEMARRDRGFFEGDWWGSAWSNEPRSRQRRGSGGGGWIGGGSWGGFPFYTPTH